MWLSATMFNTLLHLTIHQSMGHSCKYPRKVVSHEAISGPTQNIIAIHDQKPACEYVTRRFLSDKRLWFKNHGTLEMDLQYGQFYSP